MFIRLRTNCRHLNQTPDSTQLRKKVTHALILSYIYSTSFTFWSTINYFTIDMISMNVSNHFWYCFDIILWSREKINGQGNPGNLVNQIQLYIKNIFFVYKPDSFVLTKEVSHCVLQCTGVADKKDTNIHMVALNLHINICFFILLLQLNCTFDSRHRC